MAVRLNPALRSFWATKADIRILKGGRSSSKTHDAAGRSIFIARHFTAKFLCIRQFQARIADSVYTILVDKIDQGGWRDEFNITKNSIIHLGTGSSFHFYGMALNTQEIRGFEGADICWIEEAQGLTAAQWEVIEPTIRKEGSEMWILYNPRLVSDFVETSKLFKHDPENGVVVRVINYNENPFLSSTMKRKIDRAKVAMEPEEFDHVYGGKPISDDDSTIIKRSWIEAAIDAHIKLEDICWKSGGNAGGFDVADSGADKCAYAEMHGSVCDYIDEWAGREDELYDSSARVYAVAYSSGAFVRYDSIGVGAGVGSSFKMMATESDVQIKYEGFNAGGGVIGPNDTCIDADTGDRSARQKTNKEHYANIKAQAWWEVARRFRNTYNAIHKGMQFDVADMISISSKVSKADELVTELSTPRKSFDNGGKVKVESKSDLSKRGIKSPNIADAFIMANAPREKPPAEPRIRQL